MLGLFKLRGSEATVRGSNFSEANQKLLPSWASETSETVRASEAGEWAKPTAASKASNRERSELWA